MSEMWYEISATTLLDIVDAIRYVRGISGYIPIDELADAFAGKNVTTTEEAPLAERNIIRAQTLIDLADLVRARDGTTEKIRVSSLAARIRGQNEEVLKCTYYGAAVKPSTYDGAFISSLTEIVGSNKPDKFTVNAGKDEYIYYCVPAYANGFGQCRFNVNGFWGGFILEGTIRFRSPISTYSETYYIYRSEHSSLGDTMVIVE